MNTLKAEKRDVKAKRLRREGYVTGNLFGREIEGSIPVKMQKSDVERLLKTANKGSQIMLDVEGQVYNVLIKEVDFNSLAGRVDEVDFQALVSNEKVHSVAEVIFHNHDKIASYRAYPSALVDKVRIDVGEMKIGDVIKVKDLDIAKDKDIDLMTDPDAVVCTVTAVHAGEVPEEETAEEAQSEE